MNRRSFLATLAAVLVGCRSEPKAKLPPFYVVDRTGTIPPTSAYPVGTVILFRPTCENTGSIEVNGLTIHPNPHCIIEKTSKRHWRIRT